VEALPVWAGAKAAAEPRVAATMASFILIRDRDSGGST
jgi:hypothetical protein